MNDFKNLPEDKYIVSDISNEQWREVFFLRTGKIYTINHPKTLVIRKGGKTHRVVDYKGVVHCYAAPEFGETVIRWMNKGGSPINF